MFGIGMSELVVILIVALIIFGPTRLPELARSLGKAMAEFRRASTDLRSTFEEAARDPGARPADPAPAPPSQLPVSTAQPAGSQTAQPAGSQTAQPAGSFGAEPAESFGAEPAAKPAEPRSS